MYDNEDDSSSSSSSSLSSSSSSAAAPAAAVPRRDHGNRVLVRNKSDDREVGRQDALESPESLFCQYLGLEVFPEAAYLCTAFHAGQGPVSFGSDYRRRVDCLVAVDLSPPSAAAGDAHGDDDDDDDDDDRQQRQHQQQKKGVVRHLLFYNLHGLWFHRSGRHLEDCALHLGRQRRRRPPPSQQQHQRQQVAAANETPADKVDAEEEEERQRWRRVAAALTANDDDDGGGPSPFAPAASGKHDDDDVHCRRGDPRQQRQPNDWQRQKEADDLVEDSLKVAYAEALSSVDPKKLRLEYRVVHECDFAHGTTAPDPATLRPLRRVAQGRRRRQSGPPVPDVDDEAAGRGVAILLRPDLRRLERERQRREELQRRQRPTSPPAAVAEVAAQTPAAAARCWADYPNARALLADRHPLDSLLGYAPRRMTQRTLVRRILDAGFNSTPGVTMGGFVVVEGGIEKRTDDLVLPGAFAFCHQRTETRADLLGGFTTMQARMHWGAPAAAAAAGGVAPGPAAARAADARADAKLEAAAAQLGTLSTPGFHRRGTTLSLDFFRFLLVERGFSGYRLRHFV